MAVKWQTRENETLGPVLLDSGTIQERVHSMGKQITEDYHGKKPHLVGVLRGASIFHADLVRSVELEVSFDFIAVESYGNLTQSSGEVRMLKDLAESLKGRDVLLVEDIVDTGLTLHYLLQNLQRRQPNSVQIVTLLNKPSRRKIEVPLGYVGFDIPDEFVVGYGLDFDQRYRNLPDICILKIEKSL